MTKQNIRKLKTDDKVNILDDALNSCKSVFWYTLVFGFITNMMMLALPIYSLQVLDRVISSGSYDTLLMLSLITIFAFICMGLVQTARSFVLVRMGEWLDKKLSPTFFAHSIHTAVLGKTSSGSQNLRDLSVLKSFLAGPILSTLFDIPWSLIFILVIFMIHPINGTIALIGGVILVCFALFNEYSTSKILKEANEHHVKSMNKAEVASRNAEAIEAMGMMTNIVQSWLKDSAYGAKLQSIASNRASVISGVSRVIRMVLQIVVIGVGGYLVLQQQITVGAIIAGSILVGRALAPFEASISSWKSVVAARQSYHRLKDTITKIPERTESMELPAPEGVIDIEGLYFTPPGSQKPTIRDINMHLDKGDILAIIGPSAAGKSTIAKLIAGVWKPLAGVVRLDGAETYSWNRDDFGKFVGYLPQDIELFAGTVKDNIAKMNKDADPKDIVEAAKIAGVHEMILKLPNGYETEIGVSGSVLSAGQRQRIGLARAFYGKPSLVILDEPNSNLDQDGENALANAINYAKETGITTIVISHRVQILSVVEKILILKNGTVAGFGPKEQILKQLNEQAMQMQQQQQQAVQNNQQHHAEEEFDDSDENEDEDENQKSTITTNYD